MKIDVVTPKLNDTEGREVQTEGNISQINPNTETHNETVKNESFQTPMGGSTIESINTNTNNKSIKIPANRSTKIPAPKIATQQKRDTLVSTSQRSEGEEFPSRSTKESPHQKHIHSLTTWKPSHPFWQVAFDIMGPLPESSGNKYILLIGDQFTKWFEVIPMSNQEAPTVAKAFVNVWVSRFGCPANLHSDKGSNFMSNLFKNMCKELGINRTSTTAYHPQGNPMKERTNRTIEESLAKYLGEHHNTWSDYLPLVMMAYRSSIHFVTKYSPFYLLFGTIMRAAD